MKKLSLLTTSVILGSLALASCSTNRMASMGDSDNMYFMASDAKMSTEYAVQNNNPDNFENISSLNALPEENFSSRNVNPDYLSRYQAETNQSSNDEVVYFEEGVASNQQNNANIDAYNNYSAGNNNNVGNAFNTATAFNMGFGMGMMSGFSPWGMGGFYDPFWGPGFRPGFGFGSGFGFRPGFNISIGMGFGWGSPFMRPGFGWGGFYDPFNPFMRPGFGWGGGFYDPFWGPGLAWGGYPGFGYGRPIYVLPGGEFGDRRLVRGARPTRGAGLASTGVNRGSSAAALPNTSRAQARRDAMGTNRNLVSSDRTRATSRDFGTSQNDYYNSSRSRIANSSSPRNVNSPALSRSSAVRNRSAMPSARPSAVRPTNSRTYTPSRSMNNYNNSRRTISPSYNRSGTPSYNRSTPTRSTSPAYNRSNTRTIPSRSGGSVGIPSRSSGGGMSTGGSRGGGSVSSGSRGGRGN
ncbi:hypothetical protein SAMN04488104_102919 [Algoriphagus faecimaris]|uniref:Uncharacterized protein n=1 Tax=Algoriphagus faecimaris TaxID=686796 RepID=A0A1G6ULF7_9BACT|nr:hypothetical protein [Algoriphagus faecimaris]SDD42188.1 hypothetical protein SAMN04488104_102919 [Algoriphagus faecimaris]